MAAEQVQIRRDSSTNLMAATPADGELAYDQTNKRITIGDGSRAGGTPIASVTDMQNQRMNAIGAGGTANAITLTFTTALAPSAYAAYQRFVFIAANTNTGTTTLQLGGLGTKTIKKVASGSKANLTADDIISCLLYEVIYDGTDFVLIVASSGLADGEVTTAKLASDAVVQVKIDTLTGSASGVVSGVGNTDDVIMNPYCFFPMIHTANSDIAVGGTLADAANPDLPRLAIIGVLGSGSWDVDWRYITT